MPKVSVIIPVYNTEKYLRQCLDSVVNQTLRDIEIICVDDGSTDSSLHILREYAQKDSRVKVLCQQNQYAGVARNNGMAAASGEYYVFLDADDFFEPELLELEYNRCLSVNADVCICGADIFDVRTGRFSPAPWLCAKKYAARTEPFSVREIGDDIYTLTSPSPWNLMFSVRFVEKHGLRFQTLQRTNDLYFVWCALNLTDRIICLDRVLVHYRIGTTTSLQDNNCRSPLDFCKAMTAVRERLTEADRFSLAEQGFVNEAMRNCDYNLRSLEKGDPNAFSFLAKKLREEYLDRLGITGKPSGYFADSKAYHSVMEKLNESNSIKVSVVIPVYNVEGYLKKCLDSIVNQTLREIEIICVDDGSADGSRKILEDYAAQDQRVHLIKKNVNEGLLRARKDGVAKASGAYVMFVDSDDYLMPDACEQALGLIEAKQVDVLQFTIGVEDYSGDKAAKLWLEQALTPAGEHIVGDRILEELYITRRYTTSLLGKIYALPLCRAVYASIPDIYCYVGEDLFQQFYFGFFADSYEGVKTAPLYWYRRGLGVSNAGSVTLEKFELYCAMSALCEEIRNFLRKNRCMEQYRKHLDALAARMMQDCCRMYARRLAEADKFEGGGLLLRHWSGVAGADEIFRKELGVSLRQFAAEHIEIPNYVKTGAAYGGRERSPKVSVVIPVYNTAAYLRECLDSAARQTLKDVEIVCINDGSVDGSLTILEEYAAADGRFTIISQNNAGLSAARNAGMECACGKYLLFLDSDDMLRPGAAEELYQYAEENRLDILFFDADSYYESEELRKRFDDYAIYYHGTKNLREIRSGEEMFAALQHCGDYRASACLQFIRREHLVEKNISFPDGILHEDNLFTFLNLLQAERAAKVNERYYLRRIREGSVMTSQKSFRHLYGYLRCYAGMMIFAGSTVFTVDVAESVRAVITEIRDSVGTIYGRLDENERSKLRELTPVELLWFEAAIRKENTTALLKSTPAKVVAASAADEAALIRVSWTYRIGRFITFIPRKLRGGIRCYQEHGMGYTWQRLLVHLGFKENRYN